ncbi:hypothetical protein ONS95_006850 [Cadophora gregata]|uniref:uncharacterized protein n=1 Tax=Cadophora gregata TaxID=51156 RepID=UPI0026DC6007|nr:uncharacterized protein ONS95_006850 [Cadophora gregata]KAK0101694.1 hypothetical protein ONS95_006850 [Cadophora gregata]KAK0106289.1 hypothetical protein ONS96_003929 [Cadophora gregata f. sp. sojae]
MYHGYKITARLAVVLFLCQPLVLAGFNDLFHVKIGTEKSGCDDVAQDVPAIFDEAVLIINSAVESIHGYRTDFQVRKIALAFFNIQMNDEMTLAKEGKDADMLRAIQYGFERLQEIAQKILDEKQKIWIFCASDWVEYAAPDDHYLMEDDNGVFREVILADADPIQDFGPVIFPEQTKEKKPIARVRDVLVQKALVQGKNPYLSRDIKQYLLDDPNPDKVVHAYDNGATAAYSSVFPSGKDHKNRALTLCRDGFFGRYKDRLDINQAEMGVYLDSFQPKSLTLIHELYHLGSQGPLSADLIGWAPPTDVQPKDEEGNVNPGWPGDPANFVKSKIPAGER